MMVRKKRKKKKEKTFKRLVLLQYHNSIVLTEHGINWHIQ